MTTTRQKEYIEDNVYEAAYKRIHYVYKLYDKVEVSFSGGKDSTAALHTTIDVAKELGRLPVVAHFIDEEAIHPDTVEYVERVRQRDDVDLRWYCVPVKYRNACSNKQPWWYPWNPDKKDVWVRDMPEGAITMEDMPNFYWGIDTPEFMNTIYQDPNYGSVSFILGLRSQESLNRYRMIANKRNDHFITKRTKQVSVANPIYDWSSVDVWRLVSNRGLDYNGLYDKQNKTIRYNHLLHQRVCQPFGEEPLRSLWEHAQVNPELFHKMLYRVPGVATAWRYSNTKLYGFGEPDKPDNQSWEQYIKAIAESYNTKEKNRILYKINSAIKSHYKFTDEPIDDEVPHVLSGVSWRMLAKIAMKGDMKDRNLARYMAINNSDKRLEELGLTWEEAKQKYGKKNGSK